MQDPHLAAQLRPRDVGARPTFGRVLHRVAVSLAAASLVGVALAFVESWGAAEGGAGRGAVWLSDAGLLAPLALGWGSAVMLFGFILQPSAATSLAQLWRGLGRPGAAEGRARVAGIALVAPGSVVLFATATAHAAQRVLGSSSADGAAGLTLAVLTGLVATTAAVFAVGAGEGLAVVARRIRAPLDPRVALLFGAALAAALLAASVVSGDTSGQGTWLGIWGVLKRPELDLRAPAMMACLALGTLLLPAGLSRVPSWCALAVVVLPLALTWRSARVLGEQPAVLTAIERGAPLGRASMVFLRRAFDRDHDGASAWFGGGDCDDHRADVNPSAIDAPGNGLDEDCSGADAIVLPAYAVPASVSAAVSPARTGRLPDELNVLLITVDTLRADLGYAGNPRPLSPNLDALAARSIVFDRAYSLASYTGKSVGPLLIGKYPSETHRGWGHFNRYTKDTLVAERLRARGVRTLGVQAHWYFSAPFGLSRGFDVWDESAVPPPAASDTDSNVTGAALTDAALRQLAKPENTGRRFFAWMHYIDPHAEYVRHPGAPDFGTGMRAAYDGEVWYTDAQIGRVLRFVAEQPWAAKTVIMVTSDHGEAFAEHRMIRHGVELWEELVRVPLIVQVPGVAPRRVVARRSAIDLVPTLLDFFQVPPVLGGPGDDFVSGHSLVDDILTPPGAPPVARDIFVDMPAGPNNEERRAFIHGDLKLYAAVGGRFQLFDLARDPGEKADLAANKALLGQTRADYQAFRAGLREVAVRPQPKGE